METPSYITETPESVSPEFLYSYIIWAGLGPTRTRYISAAGNIKTVGKTFQGRHGERCLSAAGCSRQTWRIMLAVSSGLADNWQCTRLEGAGRPRVCAILSASAACAKRLAILLAIGYNKRRKTKKAAAARVMYPHPERPAYGSPTCRTQRHISRTAQFIIPLSATFFKGAGRFAPCSFPPCLSQNAAGKCPNP